MAKRKSSAPDDWLPQVPPDKGIELLRGQIAKGKELLAARPVTSDAYERWELLVRNYLEKAFGKNSPNVSSVTRVGRYGSFPMGAGEEWWEFHRAQSLTTQVTQLEGLVELLQTEIQLVQGTAPTVTPLASGHKVFLVHGQDEGALHATARFLEKLHQEVIVLREQPNEGKTIIEKFEAYSDVGFAIVLLTADDRGGLINAQYDDQRPRARQNVIFELGYFIGRLGRNRVCALYRRGVEIPSDYSGVLYVELDEKESWRLELAREMKAAGLPVDMNRVF